jgi:hypothetical protein
MLIGGLSATGLAGEELTGTEEDQTVQQAEQTAVGEEQAADTGEAAPTSGDTHTLGWSGPRSLDTLVDERRDALRDRREAFHERIRKLSGIYSPWMEHERAVWRAYSDRMRDLHRAHRDAMKFHHDLQRSYFMPWSRPYTETADARRFLSAMESLDRQEIRDGIMFAYQPVFRGPYLWY